MESKLLQQLVADYKQIAFQFRVDLKLPILRFTEIESVWGRWNPHHRTIEIRRKLVDDYSWDTVLYVLKHEMAHQIVTEIFNLPDSDHSDSFQKACDMLAIPNEFRKGSGELTDANAWKDKGSKTEVITTIIERIQKLFALASSTNEAEASVAVAKAHELIRKYNIQESIYSESKESLRYLLYDTQKQRLSPVYSHLASLLINFYNVDVIFTTTFNAKTLKPSQCLEIYGRETQVVIAEYVLQFLLRTLESLWKEHALKTKVSALQKKSYQLGIIVGFQHRLEMESKAQVEQTKIAIPRDEKALVALENKQRRAFIEKRYPRLRSRSSSGSVIDTNSYSQGIAQGRDVQIRKGIHKNTNEVRSLKGSVL